MTTSETLGADDDHEGEPTETTVPETGTPGETSQEPDRRAAGRARTGLDRLAGRARRSGLAGRPWRRPRLVRGPGASEPLDAAPAPAEPAASAACRARPGRRGARCGHRPDAPLPGRACSTPHGWTGSTVRSR